MILKPREDRQACIAALGQLMANPAAKPHDIQRISGQINAIINGDLSESKAAYELDTHFGYGRDWVVIHDLRIEVGGQTAQIDHVLIGRCLDIWVLESKRLANGIKVLDNGECLTFKGRFPVAIDSPIEQNRRHVKLLQRLFDCGAIAVPTRLGMKLKPRLHSLVVIAQGRISRPAAPVPGIESLIRTDLLYTHITNADDRGNPLDLAKLVSPDTLESLGRQLLAQHRPIQRDWEQHFGIFHAAPAARPGGDNVIVLRPPAKARPAAPGPAPAIAKPPAAARRPAASVPCAACAAPVSPGVKAYCVKHPERFDSRILCMACQRQASKATG